MDAPGLTKTRILVAILCGILIAFVYTYATVPHLVESPVQVITPVPTPPPVVITNQPVVAPLQSYDVSYLTNNMWWIAAIMFIIPIIIFITLAMSSNVDGDYNRRNNTSTSWITLIITLIMMGITLWILSTVIDSVLTSISVMP